MRKTTDTSISRPVGRFIVEAYSEVDARNLGVRLRQALLKDAAGMAVTAVKIEGVDHEFQAVPGVREDVLELIGNLKRLRIIHSGKSAKASLVSTSAVVTARELVVEGGRVVDPDLIIAHHSTGASLRMEILFERGVGYHSTSIAPEGFIPVEADFLPVKKASVKPGENNLDILIETDGSVNPGSALDIAMLGIGDVRTYKSEELDNAEPIHTLDLAQELVIDPFRGVEPGELYKDSLESYTDFMTNGIPQLLELLFPLMNRPVDESITAEAPGRGFTRGRKILLVDYRLEMPKVSPSDCISAGTSYEARLIVKTRVRSVSEDIQPAPTVEEEVDFGPIPLMTEDGSFIINGARRVCVMIKEDDFRVLRVGDLVMRELTNLITRIKPVLEERMNVSAWLNADMLEMLPLSKTLLDLIAGSAVWCQYADETSVLALLTHKRRLISKVFVGGELSEHTRSIKNSQFGRVDYLETPEGPNIGLVGSLCSYAVVDKDGVVRTPYREIANGKTSEAVVYLSADEEAGYKIADSSAIGADGKLIEDDVIVRDGDDIKRVPASEVQYAAVSPIQSLSLSGTLIPFLGHNDPNRALMACNMLRQAVPPIKPEQPLIKTGTESLVALNSGELVTARQGGVVVEASGERVVVLSEAGKDIYDLVKYIRTNQDTCRNQIPLVTTGQRVEKGQVLADISGTSHGELALGRNVLTAIMPFRGYNFEDAICISDELIREDAFTSVHLSVLHVDVGDLQVWTASVGARVKPGDVLVQEQSGRRKPLLTAPPYIPSVVVSSVRKNGIIKLILAHKHEAKPGDKFAGRHGNKGVIAKILPASEMPYLEDGTPVQMIINTLGIISRMNLGLIYELHYGMLAHALGKQFVIPPFMDPSEESLKSALKQAGLSETGMVTLYDGLTGKAFDSPVTVGYLYMMKLAHMVDYKIHAVSTGIPSLLTQQPTGAFRPQRLGFLDIWGLEAYGAGHMLQEALTITSDDAEGRERAALALLAGEEVEPAGEGASLKLFENALMGLGIKVEEER